MQLDILQRRPLPGIPSASGIEATGAGTFVMGDDAEHLYLLDSHFGIAARTKVARQQPPPDSLRIPKPDKPDFEALAALPDGRLLLLGSGSKSPQRDSAALVQPQSGQVAHHDISIFYEKIKTIARLPDGALNIEAAAILDRRIYLFNRGDNLVAHCPLDSLLAHLSDGGPCPAPRIRRVQLPPFAGFSGATVLPGTGLALFTASVEHTDNWVDDGEVGTSLLGLLPLPPPADGPLLRPACLPIQAADGNWRTKVESVTVAGNLAPQSWRLLLVTDNDGGGSEIMEAIFTIKNN